MCLEFRRKYSLCAVVGLFGWRGVHYQARGVLAWVSLALARGECVQGGFTRQLRHLPTASAGRAESEGRAHDLATGIR